MSIAGGARPLVVPTFHEDFNSPDADVTVISSDNIAFGLHSKNIQVNNAQGLQLLVADAAASGDDLTLEEPSSTLKILFAFLYPRRYPIVIGLPFDTLIQLAEAAEKYKIFNAASVCEHPLMTQVALHPLELLCFGVKHDYPEITNPAAIHLSRAKIPLDEIVDALPESARVSWIRYDQHWKLLFQDAHRCIGLFVKSCKASSAILSGWLEELENMSITELENQQSLSKEWSDALLMCNRCCLRNPNKAACVPSDQVGCAEEILRYISDHRTRMPTFTTYMGLQGASATEVKALPAFQIQKTHRFRLASLRQRREQGI